MTIYRLKTTAGTMYVSCDLSQASSPICTYFGTEPEYQGERDDDGLAWDATPYQCADARHRVRDMARLVADYCDMGEVLSCE